MNTKEKILKYTLGVLTLFALVGCSAKLMEERFDSSFFFFQKKPKKQPEKEVEVNIEPKEQEEESSESGGWFW